MAPRCPRASSHDRRSPPHNLLACGAQALTRILTPTKRVDLLAEVAAAKEQKRPYIIVFVGVNGVGKSTSLSK
eukprot:4531647-Prymnesium_polylepis.1